MYSAVYRKYGWNFLRDPIYNYVEFNKIIEEPIIDSAPLQRLRWIRQLQLANMVYPGADHTRFQHSIGVMHLAGAFSQALVEELGDYGDLGSFKAEELIEVARVSGLLHDVGHGPFGHAFEEAIYWSKQHPIKDHEEAGAYLIRHSEISEVLEKQGLLEPVLKVIGEHRPSEAPLALIRLTIKEWVYPADVMDFLMRDSYYTGTHEYGYVDYQRLIKLSHVNPEDHVEIALEEKALGALMGYLRSRINMFLHVYMHPVTTVYSYTVEEIMRIVDEYTGKYSEAIRSLYKGDPGAYIKLNDYSVISDGEATARERGDKRLKMLVESIVSRKHMWKLLIEERIGVGSKELIGVTSALMIRNSQLLKDSMEKELREKLRDTGFSDSADLFWINMSTLRPLPPIPNSYIQLCKSINGGVRNTLRAFIPELLEKEGIKLTVLVRVYAPRDIAKDLDRSKVASKISREVISEHIFLGGLFSGITM